MAASAITPTQVVRTGNGTLVTLAAANVDGNYYDNTAQPYIEILNGAGAPMTLYAALYADGLTVVQGRSWTIGAGERRKIAALNNTYQDPATGRVNLTYSAVTTVTIGVFYS